MGLNSTGPIVYTTVLHNALLVKCRNVELWMQIEADFPLHQGSLLLTCVIQGSVVIVLLAQFLNISCHKKERIQFFLFVDLFRYCREPGTCYSNMLLLCGGFFKFSLIRLRLIDKVPETVPQELLYAIYFENRKGVGENIKSQDWKGPLKMS